MSPTRLTKSRPSWPIAWITTTYTSELLKQKQETLKAKQKIIQAAHEQLENLRTQKSTLLARLANIEAKLQADRSHPVQERLQLRWQRPGPCQADRHRTGTAARHHGPPGRDRRPLRRAGWTLDLVDPHRDIVKEVDEKFGELRRRPPRRVTRAFDRSLRFLWATWLNGQTESDCSSSLASTDPFLPSARLSHPPIEGKGQRRGRRSKSWSSDALVGNPAESRAARLILAMPCPPAQPRRAWTHTKSRNS